jgi:predicted TIM-barrel fold metal-dependent hydrolase
VPGDKAANDAYIDALVAAARTAGVTHMALGLHARHLLHRPPTYSEDHDAWVLEAYQEYPDFILPMLGGFDPQDAAAVAYVETQLQTGIWRGIGELDLRNHPKQTTTPMNHQVLMQIYALAATYDVPVMIHHDPCYETDCTSGTAEVDSALTQNPNTTFIYAHSCPQNLIGNYANLYCEYEVAVENLPSAGIYDHVVLGTDVQNTQLKTPTGNMVDVPYGEVIDLLRERLVPLSSEYAERLASKTAATIFGL